MTSDLLDGATQRGTLSNLGATLPASPTSTPSSPTTDMSRGAVIGRYVILSKLGAGGMGVVLAAYDPELDRKIALKLLETQGQSSARTRLQREAQALAKLGHPNVVAVHDVGVHEGQLFLAMEFVAGKTLDAWMSERTRPWKEVVRVFSEAGRGLVAAHEVGLVHRDFKPDNVMLGDDGRVRVMDFGLARAKGDEGEIEAEVVSVQSSISQASGKHLLASRLTQTGAMMGTPAYMSPEQFEGKAADARSDQFGFCVALYEALYGARPFAGKTLPELCRAVLEGQVESAPKGVPVPAWLRAIVVRGLAVEPEKRWPSMQALLGALAADPAVRRRKWLAVAGVVGILGGATWGATWAVRADAQTCTGFEDRLTGVWDGVSRAKVKLAFESTNLSYAPGTWERVEQGLDVYTQQWVAARQQACEATHNGEQSQELLDLRMACLDERLLHVRATVEVLEAADEMVMQKAVTAVVSLPTIDRCADVEALRAKIPPPEDPEVAKRVAALDEQLVKAEALQRAGKYAQGLALADPVVAEATTLGYEPLLARAWLRQGWLQAKSGNHQVAETTLQQAFESALGQNMLAEAAEASTLLVHVVGYGLARHEEGRSWAKTAKPLTRAAGMEEINALCLISLGNLAFSEGQYEEARGYIERALAIREEVLGPEHPDVALALNNLGVAVNSEGKYEESRGYHERALAIREKTLGSEHPDMVLALNNLAGAAKTAGKYAEARRYAERALAIGEKALGPEHLDVALTHDSLGILAKSEGKYEEARGHHERALAIREKTLGLEHPVVALSLNNLGVLAKEEERYEEARDYYERALAIREKMLGPEHPSVALSLNSLGGLARSEEKYEEARGYHERALAIDEKALGPEHPTLAYALTGLGKALWGQAKYAEALLHLERALSLRTAHPGEPTELGDTQFALARALWDAPAEAGRDRERARTLVELAQKAFADAPEKSAKDLREVEAWQAERGL